MDTSTQLKGIVFHKAFVNNGHASPRITLWQDGSIDTRSRPATLVVFEKDREEVFTASEVKALFRKLPVQAFIGEPVVRVQDIEDFLTLQGL